MIRINCLVIIRNCLNLFIAGFEKDCHLDYKYIDKTLKDKIK